MSVRATLQLCTYNRAHLLGRVLDACFEQTVAPGAYEVVLVNDGSRDATRDVSAAALERAPCPFTVIHQANAGLARARNAGIAAARGERIIFIDDDVLPVPSFVAEHLRSHARTPRAIVRGAVIETQSLERLPAPFWMLANYSGNYFWTSNVSAPLAKLRELGNFSEAFNEYGWEDIELGLRFRFAGVPSHFNRFAVAFHYKPRPHAGDVEGMLRQARAQARTAVALYRMHPHWRVVLATGDVAPNRWLHRVAARLRRPPALAGNGDRPLTKAELRAARTLARDAYYRELDAARER
jgi:glycosyltransferase involved in cell wall biosynthesis